MNKVFHFTHSLLCCSEYSFVFLKVPLSLVLHCFRLAVVNIYHI